MNDKDEPTAEQRKRYQEYVKSIQEQAAFYAGAGPLRATTAYSLPQETLSRQLFLNAVNEGAPEGVESLRKDVWPVHQEAAEKLDEGALRGVMPRPLRDYADLLACAPRQAPLWLLQQALLAWGDKWRLSPRYWTGDEAWVLRSALKFLEVMQGGRNPTGLWTSSTIYPPSYQRQLRLDLSGTHKEVEKRIEAAAQGLVKNPERATYEHYLWLVRRHVQEWDWQHIADTYRPNEIKDTHNTVRSMATAVAQLIGLNLRQGKAGRPRKT